MSVAPEAYVALWWPHSGFGKGETLFQDVEWRGERIEEQYKRIEIGGVLAGDQYTFESRSISARCVLGQHWYPLFQTWAMYRCWVDECIDNIEVHVGV